MKHRGWRLKFKCKKTGLTHAGEDTWMSAGLLPSLVRDGKYPFGNPGYPAVPNVKTDLITSSR
jgi:hypothetical protein